MQRRVDVFAEITKFLFGLSIDSIKKDEYQQILLGDMIDTWLSLETSTMFMAEVYD